MQLIRLMLIAILVLISACVVHKQQEATPAYSNPILDKALSGEVIFNRPVVDSELPHIDIFAITDEMKAFATQATRRGRNGDEKAEKLHLALMGSRGRAIRYSALYTGTAKEVFESNKANCLGYTLLYVALARHLGLNAEVNQVMVPPAWFMDDKESYYLMQHVNAKIKFQRLPWMTAADGRIQIANASDLIVDLEIQRFRSNYKQKFLATSQVEAFFYNNRAMELATEARIKEAFLYLRKALDSRPDEGFVWSNLGTLYRRLGHYDLAESVYLKALSLNQQDLTVLHNLAVLYGKTGRSQEAETYRQMVWKYRNENPYYLYHLAIKSKNAGDLIEAKKFIERALKKQRSDDRFYILAAEIYELDGDQRKADKMRSKAESIKKLSALNTYQAIR